MVIEVIGKKLPLIKEKDDLTQIIKDRVSLEDNDVLVISETIVSKSKGRIKNIEDVEPSDRSIELSKKTNKSPRICQMILEESEEILGLGEGFIISEKNGLVCANAGIDQSNIGKGKAILPLKKPHEEAKKLHQELGTPIIISDSVGRPFRNGAVGLAKGYYGIEPFSSYVGKKDLFNKEMKSTTECVVDELASAANLVLGESNKGVPLAVIRGFSHNGEPTRKTINRDPEESIFR